MSRCLSCGGPDNLHEPHCQQERDSLRVENTRLQERVEAWKANTLLAWHHACDMQDEVVRYKALAERPECSACEAIHRLHTRAAIEEEEH